MTSVSGNRGYNLFRQEIPDVFPSKRTIQNSLNRFYVSPGPINVVIEIFANKLLQLSFLHRKVVLCFDEFSVSPKVEYSIQHKKFIGHPTLASKYVDKTVQNCLIIIAQSVTMPIRVPVSVDFTTNTTKAGETLFK